MPTTKERKTRRRRDTTDRGTDTSRKKHRGKKYKNKDDRIEKTHEHKTQQQKESIPVIHMNGHVLYFKRASRRQNIASDTKNTRNKGLLYRQALQMVMDEEEIDIQAQAPETTDTTRM